MSRRRPYELIGFEERWDGKAAIIAWGKYSFVFPCLSKISSHGLGVYQIESWDEDSALAVIDRMPRR